MLDRLVDSHYTPAMTVVNQVLVLLLLIIIGFVARKIKALDDTSVHYFSAFVLNIALPALILVSLQKPFSRELLSESAITLGLSLVVYAASFAIAAVYPGLLRLADKGRGVHRYALVFSNVGFMGYPVVAAVLGEDALFHLAIYNIPFNLLAFSIGAWLIARDGSVPLKLTWKTFVSPSVYATVLGFLFFLFSVRYPEPVRRTLQMTGDITSPLSMIVIGAILARMDAKRILGKWRNYVTAMMRLILLPLAVYGILFALGLRGIFLALPTLVMAMPVAANTTILANVYSGDVEGASSLVFISTLFCVLTIPVVAWAITSL